MRGGPNRDRKQRPLVTLQEWRSYGDWIKLRRTHVPAPSTCSPIPKAAGLQTQVCGAGRERGSARLAPPRGWLSPWCSGLPEAMEVTAARATQSADSVASSGEGFLFRMMRCACRHRKKKHTCLHGWRPRHGTNCSHSAKQKARELSSKLDSVISAEAQSTRGRAGF